MTFIQFYQDPQIWSWLAQWKEKIGFRYSIKITYSSNAYCKQLIETHYSL
jgi:hypothetical protein